MAQRDRAIAGAATLLLLVGMPVGWLPGSTGDVIGMIVACLISIGLMVAGVTWFIPRERAAGRAAQSALIVGIVAIVSLIVFWTSLPFPIGAAALALGIGARAVPENRGQATVGAVLGGVAIVLAFVALLIG
jgi:hypothetical protein